MDSRGCVFLRAGYGGQVTWVPRVSRDRKQLCGQPPSGGTVAVAEASAAPAPVAVAEAPVAVAAAPKPEPVAKAAEPKAPAPAPVVAEVRPVTAGEMAATQAPAAGATVGAAGYRLACPADTPVAERFEIRGGGSKLMCTKGDGSLDGANFPVMVAGSYAGHAVGYDAYVAAATGKAPAATVYSGGVEVTAKSSKSAKYPDAVPPPGYKMAWKDDRLNPNRGKQTAEGFLQMDEIWTRTSPAELREDSAIERRPVTIIVRHRDGSQSQHDGYVVSSKGGAEKVEFADPQAKVAKSTKSVAPEAVKPAAKAAAKTAKAPAAKGRFLVQVGAFGVSSNADGAAGRLKGLGLPVARSKAKGGALTVVYAGPFASAEQARAALSAARGAGFSDARIVQ
ncbi:MAG: SPOR domain-containing protein [Paracoccaceae bacterium]